MQEYKPTQKKLVVVMVGLPARGKTHISYKLNRYLNWIGYNSKIFSIKGQNTLDLNIDLEIDPDGPYAQLREEYSQQAALSLVDYLNTQGDVAIYNALCYTRKDRQKALSYFAGIKESYQVFWIESICQNEEVILSNVMDSKVGDEKDKGAKFLEDLIKLEKLSQTISVDEQFSHMKIINIGKMIRLNLVDGYLQSQIVSFTLNLHITNRPIYLCRCGESVFNTESKLGGDSELSENGKRYSLELAKYFKQCSGDTEVKVITSTMKRGRETAKVVCEQFEKHTLLCTQNLDAMNYGQCDGMTLEQLSQQYQEDMKQQKYLTLDFRYPKGESYLDVVHRVEPVIYEIERCKTPVLVIAHASVLKCLYAYFHVNSVNEVPQVNTPSDTIIKFSPLPYGCQEKRIKIQY